MTKNDPTTFIPGLKLAERFYHDTVRPLLATHFPALAHSAALLGPGSEVLGYDDVTSTDHHWGPRLQLFLTPAALAQTGKAIGEMLAHRLPTTFLGFPTNFTPPIAENGPTQLLEPVESGPVNHRVERLTIRDFIRDILAFDVEKPLETADWLTFPEQALLSITAGGIFHDDLGLKATRRRFAYYPQDVWLYRLAAGWARIGQEEHLMGRAGAVGDELGSALIAARLVGDIMRLCFLMERTYAPYPKWLGTAFRQLSCAYTLSPHLQAALTAPNWRAREQHLIPAYEYLAARHNALGLTKRLPETVTRFHDRGFHVIAEHGFVAALLAEVRDPAVQRIAARPPIGGIDQFSDSTDLLSDPQWRSTLRALFL